MPPPDCKSGKDAHTYNGAQRVIKKMTFKARKQGKTVRSQEPYKCPWCQAFHTTSNSYTVHNPKKDAA